MRTLSLLIRSLMVPVHVGLVWLGRLVAWFERRRFQIDGACHSNGRCCEKLLLVEHPFLTWPLLRNITRFWMQGVYPFVITDSAVMDPDTGDYFRILTCRNLVDRRCAEYSLRPRLCREWPVPADGNPPILFKGCGFLAVDRLGEPGVDVSRRRGELWDEGADGLVERWQHQRGPRV